ncbi:Serine/Threonine-Protein Kinase Sik2 [Manis pentadactyla]|nr:Serine/Threonine-Protein Kinase Sik2 [Manis pentadactyla]
MSIELLTYVGTKFAAQNKAMTDPSPPVFIVLKWQRVPKNMVDSSIHQILDLVGSNILSDKEERKSAPKHA